MNFKKMLGTCWCAASLTIASGALAGNLVIKGSTTVLPIAQKAAEDFMKKNPSTSISVSGGGSGEGVKAIIDGTCDIATSSRDMKPEELTLAKEKGAEIVKHSVAMDCVAPVVHPDNKVTGLTLEQLKDIYMGKIRNWKEVGGDDKPIVVVSRDTSSGTFEIWHEKVLKKEKVTPEAQMSASSGAVAQIVSKNRFAIGYVGIGYINKDLKAVPVNGVRATPETALDGSFPVSRALYFFTRGELKDDIKAFVEFVLSDDGQKIVLEEGFVPLKK